MLKLTQRKIRWIIRQKERGELKTTEIASIQGITPRRVNQLYQQYKVAGDIPVLKDPGRPRERLTIEEMNAVIKAHEKYKSGACMLEIILEKEFGVEMSHNKVHAVLKDRGFAKSEPKKSRQRKWVRYERKHSTELWHTDWKYLKAPNKWMIAYLDDASRFVVAYGIFEHATTANAIIVLEEGMFKYSLPDAVLTDRGSQFYANAGEKKAKGECEFEIYLKTNGIKHIVGRVNHPQTNGKIERFYGTVEQKLALFESVDELVSWYNEVRPHMSLNLDELETPERAFWRKLPPERIVGYAMEGVLMEVNV